MPNPRELLAPEAVREWLRGHREPDLKYIRITAEVIAKHLRRGQLIVLESTTYPGTTVEVVQPSFRATDYVWLGGMGVVNFAAQLVLVLFLVYFFLVTGDLYKRKVVKIAGPTFTHKKITVQILDDINQQIASFMRVQVFTSFVVAVATGLAASSRLARIRD